MQDKVSIIMPCYNKVDYIGEMFDSILAQKWNNIELILVNDGSTDGTREVIAEYELKFSKRGYEVVIIDQINQGVCAAIKAGLSGVTGKYVCCIDADDELDPEYVHVMATFLTEHEDYHCCACGLSYFKDSEKKKEYFSSWLPDCAYEKPTVAHYFSKKVWWALWAYMFRFSYLKKCNIIANYETNTRGSGEPCFMVPLLLNGGKWKPLQSVLYNNRREVVGAHSQHSNYYKMKSHFIEYFRLAELALLRYKAIQTEDEYRRNILYCKLSMIHSIFDKITEMHCSEDEKQIYVKDFINFTNGFDLFNKEKFLNVHNINRVMVCVSGLFGSKLDITNKLMDGRCGISIIAYGVLGKRGYLYKSLLEFTNAELWDRNGDGNRIKKPDFNALSCEHIVMVFPKECEDIMGQLKCRNCTIVLYDNNRLFRAILLILNIKKELL